MLNKFCNTSQYYNTISAKRKYLLLNLRSKRAMKKQKISSLINLKQKPTIQTESLTTLVFPFLFSTNHVKFLTSSQQRTDMYIFLSDLFCPTKISLLASLVLLFYLFWSISFIFLTA